MRTRTAAAGTKLHANFMDRGVRLTHLLLIITTSRRRFIQNTTIMSSSNPPVAVAANHTAAVTQAQALDQIENLIKLFEPEEDSKSTSPAEDSEDAISAFFGIQDSLILKKYHNIQKLVRDDFFDGDQLDMIDIEQEVDRAMEAEHNADLASCPLSSSSPRRRGERRGYSNRTTGSTTSESLIVMTKTYDGGSRDRDRGTSSGFIVIHNPSEVGSSLNNASAA